jgi:hypothetical protein
MFMGRTHFQPLEKSGGGLLVRKVLRRVVLEVAAASSGHAH